MDRQKITIDTYNKSAENFQNRFMDMHLYDETYDEFCRRVEKPGARILEIACGPGNITRYISNRRPDFRILGTDLSYRMIELARINVPSAEFRVMDCRNISKLDGHFDAVMCGFCLPYLSGEESAKLFCDAFHLLNPGGLLYASAMEGESDKSGFEKTSFSGDDLVYMNYHTRGYLEEKMREAGFTAIELVTRDYPEQDGTFTTDMIFFAVKP